MLIPESGILHQTEYKTSDAKIVNFDAKGAPIARIAASLSERLPAGYDVCHQARVAGSVGKIDLAVYTTSNSNLLVAIDYCSMFAGKPMGQAMRGLQEAQSRAVLGKYTLVICAGELDWRRCVETVLRIVLAHVAATYTKCPPGMPAEVVADWDTKMTERDRRQIVDAVANGTIREYLEMAGIYM